MTVVVLNYRGEMRYKDQKTFISAVKLTQDSVGLTHCLKWRSQELQFGG